MERNLKMQIRLSPEEKVVIQDKAKAAGVSASDLVRQAANRVRTWTLKDRQVEQEKIRQVARIGNNLNQIAKAVNTQGVVNLEMEILQKLADIERQILKCL